LHMPRRAVIGEWAHPRDRLWEQAASLPQHGGPGRPRGGRGIARKAARARWQGDAWLGIPRPPIMSAAGGSGNGGVEEGFRFWPISDIGCALRQWFWCRFQPLSKYSS